jgi:hydrogenase maturation protease
MARVLVLGYGNPLRSDDGLGWRIAVELFRANASRDVLVLPCHQLTPDLAETASLAETVIFVDCSHKGEPGKIHCEEVRSQSGPASFTHDLSPAALLDLAAELFGVCPRAYLFTVCGECFDPGENLSPSVSNCIPGLKAMIRRQIENALSSSVTGRPQTLVS